MRLIDADRLLKHKKFYDLPNGNRAIDEIDILHAPTVKAIPLDRIKKAREEIEDINEVAHDGINHYYKDCAETKKEVFAILDKLIEESEE